MKFSLILQPLSSPQCKIQLYFGSRRLTNHTRYLSFICGEGSSFYKRIPAFCSFAQLCIKKDYSVEKEIIKASNHRISELERLEGSIGGGHLVQPTCLSSAPWSKLHRIASRQFLNVSKGGETTTSLSHLFQCRVTHTAYQRLQSHEKYQQVPIPYSLGKLPTTKR